MSTPGRRPEVVERSRCERIMRNIFNPDKKTFLGRTAGSWIKIFIFYIVFYVNLAGFFIGMLAVLLYGMISNDVPMLTGQQTILRNGPGVGVYPLYRNVKDNSYDNTLIVLNFRADSEAVQRYSNYTEELLAPYRDTEDHPNRVYCDVDKSAEQNISKACKFDIDKLGLCKKPTNALLIKKTPCVFVMVNKIYGWLPELLANATTPMINCTGQNIADRENSGEIEYHPNIRYGNETLGKISHVHFPYLKQDGYLAPLVAVAFPNIERNVVVLMKCDMVGVTSSAGFTNFEIMLDSENKITVKDVQQS